jgi:hypothetical protein
MRLVARAQANGIQRFGAAPLPDNLAAAELLGAANAVRGGESRSGLLEFEMDLTDLDEAHGRAREILRHAAMRLFSLVPRRGVPQPAP